MGLKKVNIGILYNSGIKLYNQYLDNISSEIKKSNNLFTFIPSHKSHKIERCDVVYIFPHSIDVDVLKYKEIPIINSYTAQSISFDKIETSKRLMNNRVKTPKTLITNNEEDLIKFVEDNEMILLKYPYSCAGEGHNILYNDSKKIKGFYEQSINEVIFNEDCLLIGERIVAKPYYAQEFISIKPENKFNNYVYRMYVVGNDVKMCTIRKKDKIKKLEDMIINMDTGSYYEFVEKLDPLMAKLALKTADLVQFDIGVVDILEDYKGEKYVIECDCDGRFTVIDRKFMELPNYNDKKNFDRMIVERLIGIGNGATFRS